MYSAAERRAALAALARCATTAEASRLTGINRSTLRAWRDAPPATRAECPRCEDAALPPAEYAALLGFYLGDGHVARGARCSTLRISCDDAHPGVIADVVTLVEVVHPDRPVFRVRAPGCTVVQSHWQHWPCLFPQHGAGPKHLRAIVLDDWQRAVVEDEPAAFLRGLFHSDGTRFDDSTRRWVAGEWKRYVYPRWQFTNHSADIRELCCWALDLVAVAWRRSNAVTISVSTRAGVARLDELIGVKG